MSRSPEDLVRDGLVEVVPRDHEAAMTLVREARRHLTSAGAIAPDDPNGAYALLYDAARKAVTAHMLAHGYRVRADRPGAHRAVVLYAENALASSEGNEHVAHFDRMRRSRNRSQYGTRIFGDAEVRADLAHASGIVRATRKLLDIDGSE